MPEHDSVTRWVSEFKNGDQVAAQNIWQHFFQRLVSTARQRISQRVGRVYTAEDAAASAFNSLWQRVQRGDYPDLNDRESIWRMLLIIATRKVSQQERRLQTQKRGSGGAVGESALDALNDEARAINQVLGQQPSPEFAVELVDQIEVMSTRLGDESLSEILYLKLEGYSNDEIAEKVGYRRNTIQRKLRLIRAIFQEEWLD